MQPYFKKQYMPTRSISAPTYHKFVVTNISPVPVFISVSIYKFQPIKGNRLKKKNKKN